MSSASGAPGLPECERALEPGKSFLHAGGPESRLDAVVEQALRAAIEDARTRLRGTASAVRVSKISPRLRSIPGDWWRRTETRICPDSSVNSNPCDGNASDIAWLEMVACRGSNPLAPTGERSVGEVDKPNVQGAQAKGGIRAPPTVDYPVRRAPTRARVRLSTSRSSCGWGAGCAATNAATSSVFELTRRRSLSGAPRDMPSACRALTGVAVRKTPTRGARAFTATLTRRDGAVIHVLPPSLPCCQSYDAHRAATLATTFATPETGPASCSH